MAISVLKDLLNNPKTPPSTKLMAVNSLLDRSGFSVPTQIEDITYKKDSKTLKNELNHLLHTLHFTKIKTDEDDNGNNSNGSMH